MEVELCKKCCMPIKPDNEIGSGYYCHCKHRDDK